MCGIVGIFSNGGKPVERQRLISARDMLHKRGPDDSGIWLSADVGLAHKRLSVLDTSSAGQQPMQSSCGRYTIVYNGELYNHMELRQQIKNHSWKSSGDTELLLAAYIEWGEECLSRFHGMFAFAIWDKAEKKLFAARDRMGVKPFYYYAEKEFIFASRPRSILALLDKKPEVDMQSLRYYMECGYIPAPHSFYGTIHKLPPAHFLTYSAGGLTIKRYWDFKQIEVEQSWENRSEAELLDELDGIVRTSVRSRMVSDVSIGAFLSGGIDSSLVVAMMCKEAGQKVKSFSIGFDDSKYDESQHAAEVARYLGTEHHSEIVGTDEFLKLLPTYRQQYDEPFYDSSAFPVMAVSRLAKRHVTVSLSGDGGDELFGGYHYYQIGKKLEPLFQMPLPVRGSISALVGLMPAHKFKLLAAALKQKDAATAHGFMRGILKDFPSVFTDEMRASTSSFNSLFSATADGMPNSLSSVEKNMRLDASYTLVDDYLQKVDVASMTYSLEAREPLLDQTLIEWAMRLPLKWKMRGGVGKYLFRQLAYRYIPRKILDKPKHGFAVPIDSWLRGGLKQWAEERLNDGRLYERFPIKKDVVLKLFSAHLSGRRNTHALLWALLMLVEYCDEFDE